MRRKYAIALLALSTLGTAARVLGQNPGIQATVPFEFTFGGRLLPADTYTVTSPQPRVIALRSLDRHIAVMAISSHRNEAPGDDTKLVFSKRKDRYGDHYFLRQVVSATADPLNVTLPESKLEKQVRVQEASAGTVQSVLVAAR